MTAAVNGKQIEDIFLLSKMTFTSIAYHYDCFKQIFILNVSVDILYFYVFMKELHTLGTRPIHRQILMVYPLTLYSYQILQNF